MRFWRRCLPPCRRACPSGSVPYPGPGEQTPSCGHLRALEQRVLELLYGFIRITVLLLGFPAPNTAASNPRITLPASAPNYLQVPCCPCYLLPAPPPVHQNILTLARLWRANPGKPQSQELILQRFVSKPSTPRPELTPAHRISKMLQNSSFLCQCLVLLCPAALLSRPDCWQS